MWILTLSIFTKISLLHKTTTDDDDNYNCNALLDTTLLVFATTKALHQHSLAFFDCHTREDPEQLADPRALAHVSRFSLSLLACDPTLYSCAFLSTITTTPTTATTATAVPLTAVGIGTPRESDRYRSCRRRIPVSHRIQQLGLRTTTHQCQ